MHGETKTTPEAERDCYSTFLRINLDTPREANNLHLFLERITESPMQSDDFQRYKRLRVF